jgi:hypothetical protein
MATCRQRLRLTGGPLYSVIASSTKPMWLKDPRVARLVMDALEQGEVQYRLYERFAWVIMPNHVYLVMRPLRELARVNALDQRIDCALGQPPARTYGKTILAIRIL